MSRITPRSINIRQMQRASNHCDDILEYIMRYTETLKAGIDQYELLKMEVPDIYFQHMDKMITLYEVMIETKKVLDLVRSEM